MVLQCCWRNHNLIWNLQCHEGWTHHVAAAPAASRHPCQLRELSCQPLMCMVHDRHQTTHCHLGDMRQTPAMPRLPFSFRHMLPRTQDEELVTRAPLCPLEPTPPSALVLAEILGAPLNSLHFNKMS